MMAAIEVISPTASAANGDFSVPPGEIGTLVMFQDSGGIVNKLDERINMTVGVVDPNDNIVPVDYLNEDEVHITLGSGDYNVSKDATTAAVGVFLTGVTEPSP
jgi:hypothetical protein